MKTRSYRHPRALLALIASACPLGVSAATYQWNGATSQWQTASNWSSVTTPPLNTSGAVPPFNVTVTDRLNVNGAQALSYTSSEGTTNYGGAGIRGLVIGSGSAGSGTMNITGGTFSTLNASGANSQDIIGNVDGNVGTLNISGGSFIGASTGTSMNLGGLPASGRVSNLNISGTGAATLTSLVLNSASLNVNLDGGTLELNGFTNTYIGLSGKIRLNGGVLKARQNNAAFLNSHPILETLVQAGGAVIDTNGFNITIAEPLMEDSGSPGGGFKKSGAGLLTLTGAISSTGNAEVEAGGLALKAGFFSWFPSSFTHSGDLLNLDLGVYDPFNPAVIDTGLLTVDSAVTVNVTGSNFQVGQIPLIYYTSKSITGSLTLNTASLPIGVVATLEDDGAGLIYLDVTQAATVFDWSGDTATPGSGDWDTSSLNWNSFGTAYSVTGDQIANFPDLAGGGTVNVTAAFSPLALNISNATGNAYIFQGSGKVSGATKLNKSNTGIVKFANGNHDFTGDTTISGGALIKQAADSTTGNITVSADNASLVLDGGITDGAGQTLYLAGRGITAANYFFSGSQVQRGALQAQGGANTWEGDIVLTSNSATIFNRIGVQPGASLTLTGDITENIEGAYLLLRAGSAGENITLGGVGTYSYTSETQMFSGGGSIILGNDNKLPTGELLNLTSNGATVFDMNGYDQEFAGIYGGAFGTAATITNLGAGPSILTTTPVVDTTLTCNALITDGTGSISIVKNGEGTQVLGFANGYTGTTTVNAGTLLINGLQIDATGDTLVTGGTLGGTGFVGGAVVVGASGSVNPGVAIGTLSVDSADFSAGGTLVIDMDDAASPQTDLLSVNMDLDVSNAKLNLVITGTLAETSYLIASAGSITGTIDPSDITGLPSGYQLVQTATELRIEESAATDYDSWMAGFPSITDPNDKLPGVDADGDGLTNADEYAFGLAPDSGASANPITVALDKTAGTFSYTRRLPSLTGLAYSVWYSTDLAGWTEDAGAAEGTPVVNGSVETVPVTLSPALLGSTRLFIQVRAE